MRLRNAKKVLNANRFVEDTEKYIKRWDGILYLETKKGLLEESKESLRLICKKYKFKNAAQAKRFVDNFKSKKK